MDKMLHDKGFKNSFKNVDEMIIRLKELREAFVISLLEHDECYHKSEDQEDKEYHSDCIDHFTELIDAYTEKIDSLERTVPIKKSDIELMVKIIKNYKDYILELDGEYMERWIDKVDKLDDKLCEILYK